MVDAYGRFLERSGRKDDARAFYAKFEGDDGLQPVIDEATERMAKGTIPDRLVPTANEGAAESLFGIASSLTDATSADIAILYLRFALSHGARSRSCQDRAGRPFRDAGEISTTRSRSIAR